MSGPTPTTPAPQVTPPAATTPAPPAATTPAPPAASPAAPEGTAPAPAPEASSEDPKKRIAAILTSPEAEGREELARSFAFDSDMSSAEAIRHLASAAKAGAAAGLSASIDAEATELETTAAGEAGAPDITQRAAKRYGKA